MYTPLECARAAGFLIRRVPHGGVVARDMLLEIGPFSTDAEVLAHAARYVVLPDDIAMENALICAQHHTYR